MKEFDPKNPDKLHATGWVSTAKHGWGAWIFVGAVIIAMIIVAVIR